MEKKVNVISVDDVTKLFEMANTDGKISISFEEYHQLKKSYEEYESKKYHISLSITRRLVVDEDGSEKELSSMNTNSVSFPDDTETQLSELFNEVNENSKYVEHLESKLKSKVDLIKKRDTYISLLEDKLVKATTTINDKSNEIMKLQEDLKTEKRKKLIFFK